MLYLGTLRRVSAIITGGKLHLLHLTRAAHFF